jgi:DNA-binding NarL/FixJ family response regulator
MIKVAIIEDNINLRDRLKKLMEQSIQLDCLLAVESVEKFLRYYDKDVGLDILLLDIGLPGMSGIKGIPHIHKIAPDLDIVILTVHQDPDKIFNSICAGAMGYLLKDLSFSELENHIISVKEKGGSVLSPKIARRVLRHFQGGNKTIKNNKTELTKKEVQVVRFLVDGLSYQKVADQIGITLDGVRYHVKNIYKKLQVRSKAQVVKKYLEGDIGFEDY